MLSHRKRKHKMLVLAAFWMSNSDAFQHDRVSIKSRICGLPSSPPTAIRNHDKRKMVSRSMEIPPSRITSFRDLEQKIVKFGRAGKTDEALSLYLSIDRPTIRLMNSAIDACSRARPARLQQALEIFQTGVEQHGLVPNVFTFGALMNVCNRDRNANQALDLLTMMKNEYGVIPNAVVYSSAISACARSQPPRPDQARRLLREAVEDNELPMNVVGFNAAISACAQAGDWENAISILCRMEEATRENFSSYLVPPPDAITYGTVLAACERAEQWELVLKYAREMTKKNLGLDGLAVTSCLHACQQLGLADEALRYLEIMKSLPDVVEQTARLERSGARKPLCGPDAVAYRLAISACARGGAWKDGIQLLEEYKSDTEQFEDVVAYTAAITGCEYAGRWKEALFLLDKMRKDGVQPNEVTLAAVIGACATACANEAKTRKNTQAPEPLTKALQLLEIVKKHPDFVKPNIQVYNAAIKACAEACDLDQAFKLFQEIEDANIERTLITYGSMMTACERVGCVESASKVFRKLKDDGFAPNEIIYGAAISCCRKAKQSERALLLLKKMMKEELSPNVATFNTVMIAQTEGKTRADIERAILVYKLMKSKYATDASRPNRQTYNIIVNFFASMMQPVTAEAFLAKMREDGFVPDVNLYTATVAAYERTGQPLRALKLMESMQDDGYDFYSVSVLNEAFKKAVKLANKVGQTFTSKDATKEEEKSLNLVNKLDDDDDLILQR